MIRVIKKPTRAKRHRLNERRRPVAENRAGRAKVGEVLPPGRPTGEAPGSRGKQR